MTPAVPRFFFEQDASGLNKNARIDPLGRRASLQQAAVAETAVVLICVSDIVYSRGPPATNTCQVNLSKP